MSYTRSRGAAVAWSTAEVSLHRYPFPPRRILDPCHGPSLLAHFYLHFVTFIKPHTNSTSQNSRKFARNGRLARRRKIHSARLPRSVSVLPPRHRPAMLTPPVVLPIRRLHSPPPTVVAFALNCLPSVTNLRTARSLVNMAVLVVAWSTRATDRWATPPTTHTLRTPMVTSTSHVSKKKHQQPVAIFARINHPPLSDLTILTYLRPPRSVG